MSLTLSKKFIISLACCLGIGLIAAISNYSLTIIHALVDLVAGGRSYLKVWLLIFFLISLLTLGIIFYFKKTKVKTIPLWTILMSCLGLNLIATLYFYIKYHFAFHDFLIIFNHGQITSTKIFHSHIFKTAWGNIFNNLTFTPNQIDAGSSLATYLPSFLPWIFLAVIFIAFISVIYHYTQSIQKQPKPIFYTFIYGLLSFSLIKNLIDGGLFNSEAVVSILGLYLLLNYQKKSWLRVGLALAIFLLFCLSIFWTGFWINQQEMWFYIYRVVALAGLFSTLILFLYTPKITRLNWLWLILGISINYFVIQDNLSILNYRSTLITKPEFALLSDYQNITEPNLVLTKKLGNLNVYNFSPSSPTSIDNLINKYDLLDNYHPISIPWVTCWPNGPLNNYSFELTTTSPIAKLPANFGHDVTLNKFTWSKNFDNLWRYQIDLSINSCLPRQLNIIDEFIKQTGQQQFIISGINIH